MVNAKEVFEDILSRPTVKKLWTANFQPAIPFTPQDFDIGSLMPAMLYMFRWGHRRGKGKFVDRFGAIQNDSKTYATVDGVANILGAQDELIGFDSEASKAILGDMLLSFTLENKNHQEGRIEQIQRVYPSHYLSSWIDLPKDVANLRFIPEILVALLLHQKDGVHIQKNGRKSRYGIGVGFDENLLLSLFGKGMEISGQNKTSLTSDHFIESELSIGLEQLLTIRIAQYCGEAPMKARGGGEVEQIPNQWPLATKAMNSFREDFNTFIQAYGESVPRQSFIQMLESCISLGLSTIFFSTVNILNSWNKHGELPTDDQQKLFPLFIDCSSGGDKGLRQLSEESSQILFRGLGNIPKILMCMRIIDDEVTSDEHLRKSLPTRQPLATEYIDLLGSIFFSSHPDSRDIHRSISKACMKIADTLSNEEIESEIQDVLTKEENPISRLSEALCLLMGDKAHYTRYMQVVNSALMVDKVNGLSQKRKMSQKNKIGRISRFDVYSIILTNPMLDFIVHRHLRKSAKGKGAKPLTFIDLLKILKERYGLYVDESPPGMSIPVEKLLHNKRILERRLRDLGVLVGVNDAESMKRLKQRYRAVGDEQNSEDV